MHTRHQLFDLGHDIRWKLKIALKNPTFFDPPFQEPHSRFSDTDQKDQDPWGDLTTSDTKP
jgi:hypothetical protein